MKENSVSSKNAAPVWRRRFKAVTEPFFLLQNIIRGNIIHNWPGAFQVMRLLTIHKMPVGLLSETHPWITGLMPETNELIWPLNIAFRTPIANKWAVENYQPEADAEIAEKVGRFLASMVRKSGMRWPLKRFGFMVRRLRIIS